MRAPYLLSLGLSFVVGFTAPALCFGAGKKAEDHEERTIRTRKSSGRKAKTSRPIEKQAEKPRSKKAIAAHQKKIEASKKATSSEQTTAASAKHEPPLKGEYVDPESAAWTDPTALRDTLFLSAAARHARGQGPP